MKQGASQMLRIKFILLCIVFFPIYSAHSIIDQGKLVISIDQEGAKVIEASLKHSKFLTKMGHHFLYELDANQIPQVSHLMHENFNRCGGFFLYEDLNSFQKELKVVENAQQIFYAYPDVQRDSGIESALGQVDELKIYEMIQRLSAFKNRYYQSSYGADAVNFIKQKWEDYTAHRSDIKVENFNHGRWKQDSLILTIEGSENPEEIIVMGGHLDSISGWFGGNEIRAPGADDNASGIATLTEIVRVLAESNFRPSKTIQIMGYAAEEVGLLGSNEIAQKYSGLNKNVIGVLQFDMTNFNGSGQMKIGLIDDNTNSSQNEYLAALIDEYVQVSWRYTSCGYACSDHASWHKYGYSASFPFESLKNDMNGAIHTTRDTLGTMGDSAGHAANFSKLGVAYAMDLAK